MQRRVHNFCSPGSFERAVDSVADVKVSSDSDGGECDAPYGTGVMADQVDERDLAPWEAMRTDERLGGLFGWGIWSYFTSYHVRKTLFEKNVNRSDGLMFIQTDPAKNLDIYVQTRKINSTFQIEFLNLVVINWRCLLYSGLALNTIQEMVQNNKTMEISHLYTHCVCKIAYSMFPINIFCQVT